MENEDLIQYEIQQWHYLFKYDVFFTYLGYVSLIVTSGIYIYYRFITD